MSRAPSDEPAADASGGDAATRPVRRRTLLKGLGIGAVGVAAAGAGTGLGAYLADRRTSTYRASPRPESGGPLSCDVVWRTAPAERLAAITFDDGPDPRWTPHVLDRLAAAGATATFFQLGDAVAAHPDLAARVAEEGHEVASHAIGHKDVTRLTAAELAADLETTSAAIERACGRRPTLFRPPYGRIDAPGLYAAGEAGLRVVLWSHHMPGAHAADSWRHNIATAGPGMILLCHDGRGDPTEQLMTAVTDWLRSMTAAGYRMVTVSELLTASS